LLLSFTGGRETGSGLQEKDPSTSGLAWNEIQPMYAWDERYLPQISPFEVHHPTSFPSETDFFPLSPFISVIFGDNSGSDLNYHCRKHFIRKLKSHTGRAEAERVIG